MRGDAVFAGPQIAGAVDPSIAEQPWSRACCRPRPHPEIGAMRCIRLPPIEAMLRSCGDAFRLVSRR